MNSQRVFLLILLCLSGLLPLSLFNARITAGGELHKSQLATTLRLVEVSYQHQFELNQLARFDIWEINLEQKVVTLPDSPELQALVDGLELESRPVSISRSTALLSQQDIFQDGYPTSVEVEQHLISTTLKFPNIATLIRYGESRCHQQNGCSYSVNETISGMPLWALRLTNPNVGTTSQITSSSMMTNSQILSGTKPIFFLMGGIHAREVASVDLALRYMDYITGRYGSDPEITHLLNESEIWIVPLVNPDGYQIIEEGVSEGALYYQRKNGHDAGCSTWPPTSSSQIGVDLNRNHSFSWGGIGASADPCNLTYRGSSPASEPAIEALETLFRTIFQDQKGDGRNDPAPPDSHSILITMHSYGNLILWPWGDGLTPATAPNDAELAAIGNRMAMFNNYTACQASCLYPAAGATDDFVYGEFGIPAYTFELGSSFFPSYGSVEETIWEPNLPALLYAAKISPAPYHLAQGPEIESITYTQSIVSDSLQLTVTVTDENNGMHQIAGVELSVNRPFSESQLYYDVNGTQLRPVDGVFDSMREVVVFDGLSTGGAEEMTVYLRAIDAAGYAGPTSVFRIVAQPLNISSYLPFVREVGEIQD